jgi:putative endonuclease
MRKWRNWQTHHLEGVAPQGVWVRIPPSAPTSRHAAMLSRASAPQANKPREGNNGRNSWRDRITRGAMPQASSREFAPGWQTYLLLCADGSYYCGITSDLQTRIRDHAAGRGGQYTESVPVVALVWHEIHADRHSAATREAQIKRWGHEKKACLAQSKPPFHTMGEAVWVPLGKTRG